jgi:adenylate cyclase
MKSKFWLFQIPFVLLATSAFIVTDMGARGQLGNGFLRETLYKKLQWVVSQTTDLKFKIRGKRNPINKIVIIEVDSPSIDQYGRWPWHRDVVAKLIDNAFSAGARVVGMDMVFSEPDRRVPEKLAEALEKIKMGFLVKEYETDLKLIETYNRHSDRVVLGWTTESACRPLYDNDQKVLPLAKAAWAKAYVDAVSNNKALDQNGDFDSAILCPVTHPLALAELPQGLDKFAYSRFNASAEFSADSTSFISAVTLIANLDGMNAVAKHAGYFNAFPDEDGLIRKSPLFIMVDGKPQPSLALEMARVVLDDELALQLDSQQRVESIKFAKSGRSLAVNPGGDMEINFRGGERTFAYVSAADMLSDELDLRDELNRKLAGIPKSEVLRDAFVLIGVTALGNHDMRAFPYDSNVPGVEGHATILDNILAGDGLVPGSSGIGSIIVFVLMVVGAMLFAFAAQRLESIPALVLFLAVFNGLGIADVKLLFARNINWNTGYLYLELFSIFVFTLAVKYVLEERSKKFVRGAFTKYVAPAVVDSILKDHTKLAVGGEKKQLTVMFSDIRGFTTFSERMDAKALSQFLNDYLGVMTEIIFANHGTLDKYIGDGIMAFWGAPLDQPRHAVNACRAAIAMTKALAENKERFKAQYGVDVNVGIGINSGMMSVGNMGSNQNFAYTVIGDNVNLASRLESLTKLYKVGVVTTHFTFDGITACGEELPAHRVLDVVKVKGRGNSVELIQVFDEPLSQEGLRVFDEARAHYLKQEWDAATEKFRLAGRLLARFDGETDEPCKMYIGRCETFRANPPAKDWDGSWEMQSK